MNSEKAMWMRSHLPVCDFLFPQELAPDVCVWWQAGTECWCHGSLVNCQGSFVAGHVCVYVSWTASIDNNVVSLPSLLVNLSLLYDGHDCHANFGHSVGRVRESLVFVTAILGRCNKLLNDIHQLLPGDARVGESFLQGVGTFGQ